MAWRYVLTFMIKLTTQIKSRINLSNFVVLMHKIEEYLPPVFVCMPPVIGPFLFLDSSMD